MKACFCHRSIRYCKLVTYCFALILLLLMEDTAQAVTMDTTHYITLMYTCYVSGPPATAKSADGWIPLTVSMQCLKPVVSCL